MNQSNLFVLIPIDIVGLLYEHSNIKDFLKLTRTCKSINKLLNSNLTIKKDLDILRSYNLGTSKQRKEILKNVVGGEKMERLISYFVGTCENLTSNIDSIERYKTLLRWIVFFGKYRYSLDIIMYDMPHIRNAIFTPSYVKKFGKQNDLFLPLYDRSDYEWVDILGGAILSDDLEFYVRVLSEFNLCNQESFIVKAYSDVYKLCLYLGKSGSKKILDVSCHGFFHCDNDKHIQYVAIGAAKKGHYDFLIYLCDLAVYNLDLEVNFDLSDLISDKSALAFAIGDGGSVEIFNYLRDIWSDYMRFDLRNKTFLKAIEKGNRSLINHMLQFKRTRHLKDVADKLLAKLHLKGGIEITNVQNTHILTSEEKKKTIAFIESIKTFPTFVKKTKINDTENEDMEKNMERIRDKERRKKKRKYFNESNLVSFK